MSAGAPRMERRSMGAAAGRHTMDGDRGSQPGGPAERVAMSDEEWRRRLGPERYEVLRRRGTEPPFSGEYVHTKEDGSYRCAACAALLFDSSAKFDSGTGWPSFTEPALSDSVELHRDLSHGMSRIEVTCRRCGSHLGHVFDDGPRPGGRRFCINSLSLRLEPGRHP